MFGLQFVVDIAVSGTHMFTGTCLLPHCLGVLLRDTSTLEHIEPATFLLPDNRSYLLSYCREYALPLPPPAPQLNNSIASIYCTRR